MKKNVPHIRLNMIPEIRETQVSNPYKRVASSYVLFVKKEDLLCFLLLTYDDFFTIEIQIFSQ